jgi:KaiC/GvpD/RAD55 family RecA-like ATPase
MDSFSVVVGHDLYTPQNPSPPDLPKKVVSEVERTNKIGKPMGAITLQDVVPERVMRISTGNEELDFAYGRTGHNWGMPLNVISLWAGAGGIGKSRLAVDVAIDMNRMGYRILYFQKESPIPMFVEEKLHGYTSDSFFISAKNTLGEQIAEIKEIKPTVVFVDSVNAMKEYNDGRGAELIANTYHNVLAEVGAHAIFLSQLNQDGTIKGGTELPHYVDQVFKIHRKNFDDMKKQYGDDYAITTNAGVSFNNSDAFIFENVNKNRYAKMGRHAFFRHLEDGVKCYSTNRFNAADEGDREWYDYGPPPKSLDELPAHHREKLDLSHLANVIPKDTIIQPTHINNELKYSNKKIKKVHNNGRPHSELYYWVLFLTVYVPAVLGILALIVWGISALFSWIFFG